MMYRSTTEKLICITQPTHAWVSGQLARFWGNDRFGSFAPWEEVCLGAEQHDIGWLRWEAMPTFNAKTGYPHSFMEMATTAHVDLWSTATALAMPMGRYVALLVSLHGTRLYERHTSWQNSPELRPRVQTFLATEKATQHHLISTLERNPRYQDHVTPDAIAHNQQLVALWDGMSLAICMGLRTAQQFNHVPTPTGDTTLTLTPIANELSHSTQTYSIQIAVDPWCFKTNTVELVFEGRILQEPAPDEQAMHAQLATAPWVTLTTVLRSV